MATLSGPETAIDPAQASAAGLADCTITVRPAGVNWSVRSCASSEPLYFFSCAEAKAGARKLAKRIGNLGIETWIETYNRDQDLVSRTHFPA